MTTENEAQERFEERYRSGATPWDTGISPPELLEVVSEPAALAPGRFLDLGCGTGTNCLTLARIGWQTVGVDFAALAIPKAYQKAQEMAEEIARAGGSVRFLQADVTCLPPPAAPSQFALLLDLGCLNGGYCQRAEKRKIWPTLLQEYATICSPLQRLPRSL